ncbi:methyl-accepting chemotaxis protein [Denitrobaculum tricleocarpae]|nr:methyl-accepting chemotaxis protein [Denitrobaculum tricleocarpae]
MFSLMANLKISQKLPIAIVGTALLLGAGIGISNYWAASIQVKEGVEQKLTAIVEGRAVALSDYLTSIEQDIRYTATNPAVLEAQRAFEAAWQDLGSGQTETLQKLYITENDHALGEKHLLDVADDGSSYSRVHAAYHPWFRQFLLERSYYDIFLFDTDGNLIYSVFKELDYATNLNSGEWKDSDLGNAFRAALKNAQAGSISFFDFKPYGPSHGAPASFMSTPLMTPDGSLKGVLVFQMPIDRINAVMRADPRKDEDAGKDEEAGKDEAAEKDDPAGLGSTGQAFIVGADNLMRNQARLEEEPTILVQEVANEAVSEALAGEDGVKIVEGYRGETVLAAYRPFEFNGVAWAMIVEAELREVMAPVKQMLVEMLMIGGGLLIAVGLLGFLIARGMATPIRQVTEFMSALAKGDTQQEVPSTGRRDEIGEMAQALVVFKENICEVERLKIEEQDNRIRQEEELKARLNQIADDLDKEVKAAVTEISKKADGMKGSTSEMNGVIGRLSERTSTVAEGADQANNSMQTVASATEELSTSINEITRQVGQSSNIAQAAAKEAESTDQTVGGLAEAAEKIGDVINMIQDIAEQTNLLALNATIEAARAGEMGKGFAVVAAEVKNLANQTAKATEEISSQIGSIRSETEGAVGAIRSISGTIKQINEISESISTAVGQQSHATQEISSSVQNTVQHMTEVSTQIADVAGETEQVSAHSNSVTENADTTSAHIEKLDQSMTRILQELRDSGSRVSDELLRQA